MNIPTELITLIGSSMLGGIMRLWGASLQSKHIIQTLQLQALTAKAEIITKAREYDNPSFQWTRQLIALTCVFSVILLPKILPVLMPDVAIYFGYPEIQPGFLFFSSDIEKMQWAQLKGLVITPLDTHLLSAIVGLYFGSSLIGISK